MMNEEIARMRIQKLLLGEDSIPVQLRMRAGLNKNQFSELKEAIEFFIQYYKNESSIPKYLALAFVDISSFFYFTDEGYSEPELEELEDAGALLTSLANQLFDPSP